MSQKTIRFKTTLPVSNDIAFSWHERPGAFERLTPPWEKVKITHSEGGIQNGGVVKLIAGAFPIETQWHLRHENYQPGQQFEDRQISGPFSYWHHIHRFTPSGDQGCILEDTMTFSLPLHPFSLIAYPFVKTKLTRMFGYRHFITKCDTELLTRRQGVAPMKILVSGSSGLVGSALVPFLTTQGHQVTRLVRCSSGDPNEILWDPTKQTIDIEKLEGFDAVIHLAGENIAEGRWTEAKKKRIRDSRVFGTSLIADSLNKLKNPPKVFISASAIGIYGSQSDDVLDESSPHSYDFLGQVCEEWEAASRKVNNGVTRVVQLRTGIVLSPKGGALAKMLPIFQMGGGGNLGNGKQFMSWISLQDEIRIIEHLLHNSSIEGPVNAVAPNPVRNSEFTKKMGKVLWRPVIAPVPALGVRLLFGEMADALLLSSTRVVPRKLLNSDFTFLFPNLEDALRHELGKAHGQCP